MSLISAGSISLDSTFKPSLIAIMPCDPYNKTSSVHKCLHHHYKKVLCCETIVFCAVSYERKNKIKKERNLATKLLIFSLIFFDSICSKKSRTTKNYTWT